MNAQARAVAASTRSTTTPHSRSRRSSAARRVSSARSVRPSASRRASSSAATSASRSASSSREASGVNSRMGCRSPRRSWPLCFRFGATTPKRLKARRRARQSSRVRPLLRRAHAELDAATNPVLVAQLREPRRYRHRRTSLVRVMADNGRLSRRRSPRRASPSRFRCRSAATSTGC